MLKLLLAACLVVSSAQAVPQPTSAKTSLPADPVSEAKFSHDDAKLIDGLAYVNRFVNSAITYQSDKEHYGVNDHMVALPPDGKGDCEDFAYSKLELIEQAGFPIVTNAKLVFLVVGYHDKAGKEQYAGHAILALLLPSGAVAYLDNNSNYLMTRAELVARGYIFADWVA
jgi:predicted transglutaminase-like cysteine proteinase